MSSDGDGALTAQRFEGKPLTQPKYSFRNVPKCSRDLADSSITHIDRRECFVEHMAEMILLTKEVMRRHAEAEANAKGNRGRRGKQKWPLPTKKRTSKPLSLEYMADRTDVDDPIFGYIVRTSALPGEYKEGEKTAEVKDDGEIAVAAARNTVDSLQSIPKPTTKSLSSSKIVPYRHRIDPSKFQPSMLQGFITVTTFTNWQTTFRWDSLHDNAFSYDEADLALQMARGERKYDRDGTLAEAMQATVRKGDPWNEGIVFPRIAEISLLGGLGCGKTLVNLAIEELEGMAAIGTRNYDFAVLQATENSIPFYEAMGFFRVGAILENDMYEDRQRGQKHSSQQQAMKGVGRPRKHGMAPETDKDANIALSKFQKPAPASASDSGLGLVETTSGVFSSPVTNYVVKKQWERTEEVAKKFDVDVWDIIFLNREVYENISPRSWLKKGTKLFIPDSSRAQANACSCAVRARNLKGGPSDAGAPVWYSAEENDTPKLIAKMFDVKTADVIKANRDRLEGLVGTSRLKEGTRVRVSRFDLHDDHHVPYCHWTFPDDSFKDVEPSYMMAKRLRRGKRNSVKSALAVPVEEYLYVESEQHKGEETDASLSVPAKPKKPLSSYMIYCAEQRKALKRENPGMSIRELKKFMSSKWKEMAGIDRVKYEDKYKKTKKAYEEATKEYERDLKEFRTANPDWNPNIAKKDDALVNAVVKLNGHEEGDGRFDYYYVLTFIPDLQWCHLAPLRQSGTWGPGKEWRAKWVLVDESEGKEVDVSSSFCEPVKALPSKHSIDADDEVWDLPDSEPIPVEMRPVPVFQRPPYPYFHPGPQSGFIPPAHNGWNLMPLSSKYGYPIGTSPFSHEYRVKGTQMHGSSQPNGQPQQPLVPMCCNGQSLNVSEGEKCQSHKRMRESPPPSYDLHKYHPKVLDEIALFESTLKDRSGGDSKRLKMSSQYSHTNVSNGPVLPDGSMMPDKAPTMNSTGLFRKPRGQHPAGFQWDASRGVWAPAINRLCRAQSEVQVIPKPGNACTNFMFYSTFDDETCCEVAAKLGCTWKMLANANIDRYGKFYEDSRFEENTLLRIPGRALPASTPVCTSLIEINSLPPNQPLIVRLPNPYHKVPAGGPSDISMVGPLQSLEPGFVCDKYQVYCTMDNETCEDVGKKLGCNWRNIAIVNRNRYGVIKSKDRFEERTLLLLPKVHDSAKVKSLCRNPVKTTVVEFGANSAAADNEVPFPGKVCADGIFYCTIDDETCDMVASKLGCHWQDLSEANKERYGVIKAQHCFEKRTLLRIPEQHNRSMVICLQNEKTTFSFPMIAANPANSQLPRTTTEPHQLCTKEPETSEPVSPKEIFYPGHVCRDCVFYCTLDNETPRISAEKLGCEWKELVAINKKIYKGLVANSLLEEGTVLRIPEKKSSSKVLKLYRYEDGEERLDICYACDAIESADDPPMLLCDGCDAACHLTCTHDNLSEIPEGDWFCKSCSMERGTNGKSVSSRTCDPSGTQPDKESIDGGIETKLFEKHDVHDVPLSQADPEKSALSCKVPKATNYTLVEVDEDKVEFRMGDGETVYRRIDLNHKPIEIGSLVRVAYRSGSRKEGGLGKVKARRGSVTGLDLQYDVTYVMGGRESKIEYRFVVLEERFNEDTAAEGGADNRAATVTPEASQVDGKGSNHDNDAMKTLKCLTYDCQYALDAKLKEQEKA